MYGNVQHIPVEQFDHSTRGSAVPPSLWLAAEDDDLPPLLARRRGLNYEIIAGTEIWRAATLANRDSVPAFLVGQVTDLTLPQGETKSSYMKDPVTEANAIEILKETHDLTDAELGRLLSWSRKQVADYRRLLRLEPTVREMVKTGKLSYAKAAELVSIPPNRQPEIAKRAYQLGYSLADIRASARRWKTPRTAHAIDPTDDALSKPVVEEGREVEDYSSDPNIRRLEALLEERLGCQVRLDVAHGALSIHYGKNEEVLDGLLEHLGVVL